MHKTMIAAHTGCGVHPDNTFASFLEALALGADIAEVDVRATLEGTAILMHEDSPYLRTHSYEQLNKPDVRMLLDPAYEFHEIATLEQIFEESDSYGTLLNLDLKTNDAIEPAVRLIRRFGAQKRVYVTGCSDSIRERFPDIQVMLNTPDELTMHQKERYDQFAEYVCNEARRSGYAGLNMNGSTCLPQAVKCAHACGLMVWVYTVNEEQAMEWSLAMGVDAITTRKPKALLDVIKKHGYPHSVLPFSTEERE
jgi:glycerophosphoryl diester phosphodiesterase